MDRPIENQRYYNPLEKPRMYPLELNENLHIYLWDEAGKYKWTIAYWVEDKEGAYLKFVGDRPLDKRVNWHNFEAVVRQGQLIADQRWTENNSR